MVIKSHDSLNNPIFQTTDEFPKKNYMIELLKNFKIVRMYAHLWNYKNDHVGNYFFAKKLLEEAQVYP